MVNDTITLRYTPPTARQRRLRFEPRAPAGWTRIEQEWTGEEWRTIGQEIVAELRLEAPAAVVANADV